MTPVRIGKRLEDSFSTRSSVAGTGVRSRLWPTKAEARSAVHGCIGAERLFETFRDRLLNDLRIAKVRSLDEASRLLDRFFLPFWQERRST